MNGEAHYDAASEADLGEAPPPELLAVLELIPWEHEAEAEWRERLAARGVRVVPATVREARHRASLELLRRHDPTLAPDHCAKRSDGTLVGYDRSLREPGARPVRTIPPEKARQALAPVTRAALEKAGLMIRPVPARTLRSREARPALCCTLRPGKAPPTGGDPSGSPPPEPSPSPSPAARPPAITIRLEHEAEPRFWIQGNAQEARAQR